MPLLLNFHLVSGSRPEAKKTEKEYMVPAQREVRFLKDW